MALVIKALSAEGSGWEVVGVVKDGEVVGDEPTRAEFGQYPLDRDGAEEAIAEEYTSHALNASLVPDEEVDLDEYRGRWDDDP